jgi:hypothetical protein
MECVGVQLDLGIGLSLDAAADDGLDIIKRLGSAARDISHDRFPLRTIEHPGEIGKVSEQPRSNRHTPGNRVTLLMLAAFDFRFEQV